MSETKRDYYIRKIKDALKSDIMSICHELFLTEGAVEEILELLMESDASDRNVGMWVSSDSQCGIGCPFCGKPVDDFCNSIDYIDLLYEPNFCPNCGAELKGGK